jgi:S-DNA-T family DNA segregation ATPase FtsK/SpoIIIE
MRLNLEIAGIAAFGIALLLAIALFAPTGSGAIGAALAHALHVAFGNAAWFAPVVVAIIAGIVFLEINVPRQIATLGFASVCYFCIVDAFFGRAGGSFGTLLKNGLHALVGGAGSNVALVVFALALGVWISGLSVKKLIGHAIVLAVRLRNAVLALTAGVRERSSERATLKLAKPAGPTSLREAFHLPAIMPQPSKRGATKAVAAIAPIAPIDAREFVQADASKSVVAVAPPPAIELEEDEDDDEYEFEDDEEVYDEAEEADEDDNDDEVVVGEYEEASPVEMVREREPGDDRGVDRPDFNEGAKRVYQLPDLSLFDPPQVQIADDTTRSTLLEDTLASFGVNAKVVHIERGPSITRYELKPERGIKISRISALSDDIALALAATSIRIEAPIPGKSAVGIEVPNKVTSIVSISEILSSLPQRGTVPPLHMALGKDITGRPVFGDLGKMPHLLVAGATGSGKSVCLNTIIASLLVSATPDQVQMLFIDPKRVELTVYNGIPHLIKDVITDPKLAAGALYEMTREMDSRYERFAKAGVRKIEEYNAKFPDEKLPFIVIIIDELADLMLIAPGKVETVICRLAQLARATGMHLVVATQRPSVDVITGIIKANIPSRIAFAVSSQIDSRTILDMGGAERLLGRGDMLYLPIDAPKPVRAQGALITGSEVSRLVDFWKHQARPENMLDVEFVPIEEETRASKNELDALLYDAAVSLIETQLGSTAQLQKKFSIGHPRAVRIMEQLERFGVVGPNEGTKPRQVIMSFSDLEPIASRLGRSDQTDMFAQNNV